MNDQNTCIGQSQAAAHESSGICPQPDPAPETAPSLDALMDNLKGMLYRCRNDRSWTMMFLSEGCRSLTGYEPSDLLANERLAFASLIHPADRRSVWRTVQCAIAEDRAFRLEFRIISANGEKRWVRATGCAVFDSDGQVDALEGFIRDISEEKKAEREIRFLGEALKSIGDAVTITDLDHRILFANQAFTDIYGYSRAEVQGLRVDLLRVEDGSSDDLAVIARETVRRGWKGELTNRRKNGTPFPAYLSTSALRDEEGQPVALIGVVKDLTEEKKLQDQLHQAQRLEAVGRLAGGVAHDFNNLLTVINGYSEILLERIDPADPAHKPIEQIAKAGHRAGSLTQQLLAFSRKQMTQPKVLNLNRQITETEKMLRRLIGEDIQLRTQLAPDLGFVKADPSQIDQILLNLAVNARDAMPQGGELVIESANFEADEAFLAAHPPAVAGHYVMLAVSDTGAGMDAATRERIFEPFFTTKNRAEGTGLGLATVYGIVKQNRGYIWVYSELGEGTCFKIFLSRIDEETSPFAKPQEPDTDRAGSETILLVEDETTVRDLTARVLETSGYRVLKASNAEEALAIAESHEAELPLLVTDVVLPGLCGHRLAQRMRASRPETAVIYMSGYTDDTVARYGIEEGGVSFVQKPCTNRRLLGLVRKVLDQRSGAMDTAASLLAAAPAGLARPSAASAA